MPYRNSGGNSGSKRSAPSRSYGSASPMPTGPMSPPTPTPMVQQQRPPLIKEMAATAGGVAVGSAIPEKVVVVQHQQPGMAKTFGATAAGVAVGSAVGHAVGNAITGGGGHAAQQQAPQVQQSYGPTEPTGPCAWEIKQFLQCAENESDLKLCEGFNEAIRQCKKTHGIK